MSDEQTAASFDAQFEALSHIDRRRLLSALLKAKADDDLPVTIDQLERDAAAESFEMSMYHLHIPNLEEKGLIDTTEDERTVTPGPRFDAIQPLLELVSSNRERLPNDWV